MPSADQMFTIIESYDAMTITQLQVSFPFLPSFLPSTRLDPTTLPGKRAETFPSIFFFSFFSSGLQNRKGHAKDRCSYYDP